MTGHEHHAVRMLGYNGSIPGPTLRVPEGAEVIVDMENEGDMEATVHWHGLRLENRYDGVPHDTQAPIQVGETFTYEVHVPDPGAHWYHPHIREDYGQELGLYGNILVTPSEPDYWPPANRELLLTLDDIAERNWGDGLPIVAAAEVLIGPMIDRLLALGRESLEQALASDIGKRIELKDLLVGSGSLIQGRLATDAQD